MGHARRFHCASTIASISLVAALFTISFVSPVANADEAGPPIRIEEDWYLEIIEPSYEDTSPQITNTISPTQNLNCKFGLFEINHGTQPEYRDGGLGIQIWDHDSCVNYRRHSNTNRLSHQNEVVRYTIGMSIYQPSAGGSKRLSFKVKNGTSQTWGNFGNDSALRCSVETSRQDLSNYSPQFSVENSKVGYASYRVRKYALVAVRYYDQNGLIQTDTTERVAHEYNDDVASSDE